MQFYLMAARTDNDDGRMSPEFLPNIILGQVLPTACSRQARLRPGAKASN